jgi:hypothetical protein
MLVQPDQVAQIMDQVILVAIPHIQEVEVEVEVVAAVVLRLIMVVEVEMVQFGNKHLIAQ